MEEGMHDVTAGRKQWNKWDCIQRGLFLFNYGFSTEYLSRAWVELPYTVQETLVLTGEDKT